MCAECSAYLPEYFGVQSDCGGWKVQREILDWERWSGIQVVGGEWCAWVNTTRQSDLLTSKAPTPLRSRFGSGRVGSPTGLLAHARGARTPACRVRTPRNTR